MSTLFLKYRPQTFEDLVGQSNIRKTLQNALKAKRPSHAYLFAGVRGTGKTSTARIFAKGLNCKSLKDGDPCDQCDLCQATTEGSLVDVIEIDAASNRGIDEIRDLREKINFAPSLAERKVYIIDEVHMLTKEAFNALLKTLEEPPDHAFFCLATTEMHKIPQTILSRCQVFTFNRFPLPQLISRLAYIGEQEGFEIEEGALDIIARKAEGGMRDAISLLEQVASETQNHLTKEAVQQSLGVSAPEKLEQLFKSLENQEASAGLDIIRDLGKQGLDFRSFGHDFLGFLRSKMLSDVAASQDVSFTLQCIEAFEKALNRLKSSPIMELPLEIAVVELCQRKGIRDHPPQTLEKQAPVVKEKPSPPTQTPDPLPKEPQISQKPEKIPQTESKAPPSETFSHSVKEVQAHMKDIADKAGLPAFVKKSFLTTIPNLEEGQLIFATDSEFHREKLDTPTHKGLIQKAIIETFGQKVSITFLKKSLQRKTPSQSSTTAPESVSAEDFLVF